jgi:hypothetical protein
LIIAPDTGVTRHITASAATVERTRISESPVRRQVPAYVAGELHVRLHNGLVASHIAGFAVEADELIDLGFSPFELEVRAVGVPVARGIGCEWSTLGAVPDHPGLYAFTTHDDIALRVTYVGRTEHLWMVTKGRLPRSGGARPGQRYGRPRYAGITRQRINILVAAELAAGRHVQHWLRALAEDQLVAEEERLIRRWRLREVGWNRG